MPDPNRFWTWAVRAYAGEGVAEACLALQDGHGQCVPLLLWAAWAGDQAVGLAEAAAALAQDWQPVILPLREVRRRLKSEISAGDHADRLALRSHVKVAELNAEKVLMVRLAGLATEKSTLNQPVAAVLCAISAAWGIPVGEEAVMTLVQALIKGGFLEYSPG